MRNSLARAFQLYFENAGFILISSVLALVSLGLLPFVSTYVSAGAGFVRFSSILYDMTLLQIFLISLLFIASIFLISLFVSAVVSIIKYKETLDVYGFTKVASIFGKYVSRVFVFFLVMSLLSVLIGVFLTWLQVPFVMIQAIIFAILTLFIFTPQIIVLENFPLAEAMEDSVKFVFDQPLSLLWYLLFGLVALLVLTLLEVFLGTFMLFWHKIIILIITSVFVLPVLQIFAAVLYVRRYGVARL